MIVRKSDAELAAMARAGAVVAQAHAAVAAAVRPGTTTAALDRVAEAAVRGAGATPSFKGYRGFPATICTSVNDRVVHGIPDGTVLRVGDVLSVDCGAVVDGFHGDAAVTHVVGPDGPTAATDPDVQRLVDTTDAALRAGIAAAQVGNRLGDIGAAVQGCAEAAGLGIVRGYVGHGIGRALHEDPSVPNHGLAGRGARLEAGWVLAIEPMCTLGAPATRTLADRWTVVTEDGSLAAHFEHTVAVTAAGPRVLTVLAGDDEPGA